jgi:hypothetical protein
MESRRLLGRKYPDRRPSCKCAILRLSGIWCAAATSVVGVKLFDGRLPPERWPIRGSICFVGGRRYGFGTYASEDRDVRRRCSPVLSENSSHVRAQAARW